MNRKQNKTVMVVDDSTFVLHAVRLVLEKAGYRVITRDVAVGASGIIMREKPDLVLLDVNMPGIEGPELVTRLRQNERLAATEVLFYSSCPVEDLERMVDQSGANGYVRKGDDLASLCEVVAGRIGGAEQQQKQLPSLLFVDDDLRMLRIFERELGKMITADYVSSAAKALQHILSASPPDVVVADLVMPGMSGIELLERALARDDSWNRRFIFLTGLDDSDPLGKQATEKNAELFYKPLCGETLAQLHASIEKRTGESETGNE